MRIGILSSELDQESKDENKRLIREIRLKGHRPQIINYRRTVLVTAKGKALLYQLDDRDILRQVKIDAVIPRINEADEQSINLGTLALESLIASGVYSTASPSSIRLSKNKIASLMVLSGGISVPRTAAITGTELQEIEIDKILNSVEPNASKRLVIKTNMGTHGRGVMPANSRGEARAILDGFSASNIPVLIQQFIEPTKKNRYTDIRFIVIGGKVVASMQRLATRKDEMRANIAQGGIGLLYEPSESEILMALKATRYMGLGIAGVDIIPSGSRRFVVEVNSSPGFTGATERVTGVNIARKMVTLAVAGARRGEKTMAQKMADKLATPVQMPTVPIMTPVLSPLVDAIKPLSKNRKLKPTKL